MRLILLVAAAAVAGGCATQPPKPPPETAARDVLESYRLPAMLEQAAPIVSDSLEANLPAEVTASERERLREAIARAFDAKALRREMVNSLVGQARDAERIDALYMGAESLKTELAQRMVKLEEGAADENFSDGFGDFMASVKGKPTGKRMDRAKQLADSLQLVDLQTAFNAGLLRGMVRARNAAAAKEYRTSDENLKRMVDQASEGIASNLASQLPTMLYYVYRDVPEADMAEYTAMQTRDGMQWLNGAVAEAMDHSLSAAAQEVGKRYARMAAPGSDEAGGDGEESERDEQDTGDAA